MIGIIDYGAGNLRSVQKAFEKLGLNAVCTSSAEVLDTCERLVLPGVGNFAQGIAELKQNKLFEYIIKRKNAGGKILGICLGMQFFLEKSSESGEHTGFGFIKGEVVRFEKGKVPQIGWNGIYNLKTALFSGVKEYSSVYFVHSYRAVTPAENSAASCDYFTQYPAAVRAGNVYGVQFHPEKSGDTGLKILSNFAAL